MNNLSDLLKSMAILLLFATLTACGGAEDGDLIPPNFTFDGGVPSVTNEPGDQLTPYTFTGTTDPGTEVSVEVFPPAGGVAATVTDPVVNPDGSWSFELYGLDEGVNQIIIEASDPTGNSRILPVYMTLDLTGPVATIDQFQTPVISGAYDFAGTVSEAGATVDLWVTNSLDVTVVGPLTDIPSTVGNGVWTANVDLTGLLPDVYTVNVEAKDIFGNVSELTAIQPITIAATVPTLTVSNPATVFPYDVTDPDVTADLSFSGTKESGCDLTVTATVGVIASPLLDDSWSFTLEALAVGNTLLTFNLDGATCTSGPMTSHLLVVRDLVGPTVAEISPGIGQEIVAGTTPTLTVVFSEEVVASTIVADSTVVLENIDDLENPILIPLTDVTPVIDNVTFEFEPTAALSVAGRYRLRIENDELTPRTITDDQANEFVGSGSTVFFVK